MEMAGEFKNKILKEMYIENTDLHDLMDFDEFKQVYEDWKESSFVSFTPYLEGIVKRIKLNNKIKYSAFRFK